MAQTTICIRLDEILKKEFEQFCSSTGMSMSTAINIFINEIRTGTTDSLRYYSQGRDEEIVTFVSGWCDV